MHKRSLPAFFMWRRGLKVAENLFRVLLLRDAKIFIGKECRYT
jgi:hypothetical protein